MPDQDKGSQQKQPEKKNNATPAATTSGGGRYPVVKILVSVAILAAALFAVYRLGLIHRFAGSFGPSEATTELAPALSRLSPDNTISSAQLLADLGRSPVDPSKVLFPGFEKSVVADPQGKPRSCPPGTIAPPAGTEPGSGFQQAGPLPPGASRVGDSKALEAPLIVTRGPGEPIPTGRAARKKKGAKAAVHEPKPEAGQEAAASGAAGEAPAGTATGQQAKSEDGAAKPKEPAGPAPEPTKPPESADQPRPEYQRPGTLVVKVQNYSGTVAKWGVMVILDDSAAMARRSKSWEPNRMAAATALVRRLPEAVTPGSKMAVRDFLCSKSDGAKKGEAPCLSHMLYEWADHPFKGLKEKLENVNPGGQTNVCAAAAYALKKEFSGLKDLTPRLLLVTSGSGKCTVKEVKHALDQRTGQGPTTLDVIAFAMAKKREGTYSELAKKGHGLFLRVENPADLDQALARYGKALKTKVFERIEVKGDKAVFNTALEEEIALPPGSYSVTLPAVAGIAASKRTIPNIKISSGEARVLEIQVKKGQPHLRAGKK